MKQVIRATGCFLLAAGVFSAPADAIWAPPEAISEAGKDAMSPQVAVADDGHAVFVWARVDDEGRSRVQTRTREPTTVLTPVQTLSAPGESATLPDVGVDDEGNAVFTWQRSDGVSIRVQTRARDASSRGLTPIRNVSAAGRDAINPQIAVDTQGDAVVAWRSSDGTNDRIQVRARDSSGALSAVQNVSNAGQDARLPQVAVDFDGDAVLTWQRPVGGDDRIQARARSSSGTLSSVQNLSSPGQDAALPQVDVDDDGDAVFAWRRSDGAVNRIQAIARSAAGTLSAVQTLSTAGESATDPHVAVDPDGDAAFTWQREVAPDLRVQARTRSAAGALSGPLNLSAANQDAFEPSVAIDGDGDATFAWRRFVGSSFRIQGRTLTAGGTLGAVSNLSTAGQSANSPELSANVGGAVIATWLRLDATGDQVEGAAGP